MKLKQTELSSVKYAKGKERPRHSERTKGNIEERRQRAQHPELSPLTVGVEAVFFTLSTN